MKIASAIANYSLGEADLLRRAMGKKKAEEMEKQRELFTSRAEKNGFDRKKAGELFDLMAYFAGYGFNKSHSAAYGLIAYQTAYLKAHYPAEFMACLISLEARDPEKMAFYIQEAKDNNLNVLPPDINHSEQDFTTRDNAILFGLQGIKNVGGTALENIVKERTKNGPYKDLLNFCLRVDLRVCNKRVIENLIAAGAFDTLPGNRAQKTEELEQIMERAAEKKKADQTGQMGLFSTPKANTSLDDTYAFTPRDEWDIPTKLKYEKEVLGLYMSARPLDSYKKQLRWLNVLNFKEGQIGDFIVACGVLKSMREITTKKGDKMAFVQLEDYQSKAELIVFPKVYAQVADALKKYTIFLVKGVVDMADEKLCKIKANEIIPLETLFQDTSIFQKISLKLPEFCKSEILQEIKKELIPGKTPLEITFTEHDQKLVIAVKDKITCSLETLLKIDEWGITVQTIL
jgi:DNA polymerase III subunit alpha